MNANVIHEVMNETEAGQLIFPEVIRRLSEVGVESYFVDLATGSETFYGVDGTSRVEAMKLPRAACRRELRRF